MVLTSGRFLIPVIGIFTALAFASCSAKLNAPSQLAANQPALISVQVDLSKATVLQRDAYGVNNEFIHPPYTPNFKNYKDAYRELGKPTFRYPAGTGANFLNLATGFPTGWKGIDAAMTVRLNDFQRALKQSGKGEDGIDIQDFIQFMKEEKAVCNFVVNVSSASVDDNRKVLLKIKNSGVILDHFELGNELYYPSYRSAFATVADYIARAKETSAMIRSIFPAAKIAVGVNTDYFTKEIFLESPPDGGNRMERWYRGIRQEKFYDAIAVHMYASIGMDGKVKRKDFLPFKEAYDHAISHADSRARASFDRMKADFPGKEIWLTEYHVGGFAGEVRQYRLRYTYLGGLYCADFLLKILADPQITLSNWHSMMQLLDYKKPANGSLINGQVPFEFKVNYYFLKAFKEPVLNSTHYVPVTLSNVAQYQGVEAFKGAYSEMDAGVFYNNKTGVGYLMLLNKKETSYRLSTKELERALKGKVQSCTELSPDTARSLNQALVSEEAKSVRSIQPVEGAFGLKPYSVYVVKFSITGDLPRILINN